MFLSSIQPSSQHRSSSLRSSPSIDNNNETAAIFIGQKFLPNSAIHVVKQRERKIQKEEALALSGESFSIHSCRYDSIKRSYRSDAFVWYEDHSFCGPKSSASTTTANTGTPKYLYVYNPFDRERILQPFQDLRVPPHSYQKIDLKSITSVPDSPIFLTSSLFPAIPSHARASELEPTVIGTKLGTHPYPFEDCDVPCVEEGKIRGIMGTRLVKQTDWTITFSMEGEAYYPKLHIDPEGFRLNHFYSTTHFQSDIPLPYFSWAEYSIQQEAVPFDKGIKAAVFMARNCNSHNNREKIVQELIDSPYFRVDSVSSCLHNADVPPGSDKANKSSVLRKYLFYLAFENQCTEDYITEKMWGALGAGPIPVYYGATNIHEHVPPHSIINVGDFNSTDDLAMYLNKVANDRSLYDSYHTWRKQPLPSSFVSKYNFTHIHGTCRTCRWAFARMYGLGWNHFQQEVRDLVIPRDLCWSKAGVIVRPFREVLPDHLPPISRNNLQGEDCSSENTRKPLETTFGGRWSRKVAQHDGVIDILLTSLGDNGAFNYVLETFLSMTAEPDLIREGQVRLQDDKSRYTLLWNPPESAVVTGLQRDDDSSLVGLKMEISQSSLRVRVIVEDLDPLHELAHQDESYFGSLMIRDFWNPLEVFYAI